jgi:hypothetical protein
MLMDHSNLDFLSGLFGERFEKVNAIVSVGMISTPLWLQYVKHVSDGAAVLAPILGCVYLSMQIGYKLWDRKRRRNDDG